MRNLIALFKATVDLATAEARTGISLVEAVAADSFHQELVAMTTPEELEKVRDIAVELVKLGIGSKTDVWTMVKTYYRCEMYGLTFDDLRTVGLAKMQREVEGR